MVARSLRQALASVLALGLLKLCKSGGAGQVSLSDGDEDGEVDLVQHYGFASVPPDGTGAVVLRILGRRIVVAERGKAADIPSVPKGGACLFAGSGCYIMVNPGGTVHIQTTGGLTFDGDLTVDGKIEASGEVTAMKGTAPVNLSTHKHPTGVGPSGPPTPGP